MSKDFTSKVSQLILAALRSTTPGSGRLGRGDETQHPAPRLSAFWV